jgi:hypothetical protein
MRIRAAGARGGDARSVGGGCRSAQAARSASQPGSARAQPAVQVGSGQITVAWAGTVDLG